MTTEEIRSTVRALVAEIYELEEHEVQDDQDIYEVYGGDSINKFELIAALERKYGIRYGGAVEHLNSITALVKATEEHVHVDNRE